MSTTPRTHTMADGREVIVDRFIEGGRYNVYQCPVGHNLLSLDVDEGVTPFMSSCPDHDASATSAFYAKGIADDATLLPVRMVWRLATPGEMKRERKSGGDHYAQGGLAREWTDPPAPPRPTVVPDPPQNRQQRRWAERHA